ncbi:HAAS signaling domain-containing protein [Cognatilysobacter bugurensis]|uniref:DUF1700 domain-containing protein n=1 Tax=Cognatilysobacter bugurensis TaxID=543356 RepID=A0A918SX84_9GAMM|nr:hypothetical protein [Lysobacter bugurensis]GHA76936.1 hypothetical protein GCM10007067_12800 [Lysobacter bugurensis]
MSTKDRDNLDGWLRRLEWALSSLPNTERADIVREARSHLEERGASGVEDADALRAMGSPEDYARGFLDDYELARALGEGTATGLMAAVGQRTHRSAIAFGAFVGVLLLGLLGAGVLLTALMHFIDPTHWGLWASNRMLLLGQLDDPADARELLGAAIYPFAAVVVAICWVAGRLTLIRALKALAVQPSSSRRRA